MFTHASATVWASFLFLHHHDYRSETMPNSFNATLVPNLDTDNSEETFSSFAEALHEHAVYLAIIGMALCLLCCCCCVQLCIFCKIFRFNKQASPQHSLRSIETISTQLSQQINDKIEEHLQSSLPLFSVKSPSQNMMSVISPSDAPNASHVDLRMPSISKSKPLGLNSLQQKHDINSSTPRQSNPSQPVKSPNIVANSTFSSDHTENTTNKETSNNNNINCHYRQLQPASMASGNNNRFIVDPNLSSHSLYVIVSISLFVCLFVCAFVGLICLFFFFVVFFLDRNNCIPQFGDISTMRASSSMRQLQSSNNIINHNNEALMNIINYHLLNQLLSYNYNNNIYHNTRHLSHPMLQNMLLNASSGNYSSNDMNTNMNTNGLDPFHLGLIRMDIGNYDKNNNNNIVIIRVMDCNMRQIWVLIAVIRM